MSSSNPTMADYNIAGEITLLDGTTRNFSFYEGNITLVEAIQTTCSHCKNLDYRASFADLYDTNSNRTQFLTLSVREADTTANLTEFQSEFNITWDIGQDTGALLFDNFDIPGTPTLLILDEIGDEVTRYIGSRMNFDSINRVINDLFDEDPNTTEPSATANETSSITSGLPFYSLTMITAIGFLMATYTKHRQ